MLVGINDEKGGFMCPNMCAFVACVCKLRPYKKRNQKREEGKEEMKGPEGGGVGGGGRWSGGEETCNVVSLWFHTGKDNI